MNSHERCQLLVFQRDTGKIGHLDDLMALTRRLVVPTILCEERIVDADVLQNIANRLGRVDPSSRPRILLCGAHLEEQISIATQFLLAEGYEVVLVRDLILAKRDSHAQFHDQRFIQIGAVTTTLEHLAYEWTSSSIEPTHREVLLQFSKTISGS